MVKFSYYHSGYRKWRFLWVVLYVTVLILLLKKWDMITWNLYTGPKARHCSYLSVMPFEASRRVPLVYAITPTYTRAEQKAELTRLSYTLRHVERLHWIVIEDAAKKSILVTRLLQNCKVAYTHLNVKTPPTDVPDPRLNGGPQRNKALHWLYEHAELPSVVYFADDDNTYDLQLFEEMRNTTKVSVWPVAFAGGVKFETPAVKDGKVVGWVVGFKPSRSFGLDMASFAVNTAYLLEVGKPKFSENPPEKLLEPDFLGKLHITLDDLEPKADNCSKVLVWHTQTSKPSFRNIGKQKPYLENYSVPDIEV